MRRAHLLESASLERTAQRYASRAAFGRRLAAGPFSSLCRVCEGSSAVDYAGFLKAADAGAPPAVALLHGPEALLLDDAVGRVTRGLFPDGGDLTLSREILDSREAGVEGIVHAALLLPWIGSRRLVVARGIEELGVRAADPLAGYCRAPNPSTVLMLLAPQALTATHWLHKAIPRPLAIAVQAPIGGQLVAWLRARARAQDIELTADAAALLVQLAGDDLTHLCGEVEKAALAGGADNRRVGATEVRAVVGETRARHVFDLTRALVDRDRAAALALPEHAARRGRGPVRAARNARARGPRGLAGRRRAQRRPPRGRDRARAGPATRERPRR